MAITVVHCASIQSIALFATVPKFCGHDEGALAHREVKRAGNFFLIGTPSLGRATHKTPVLAKGILAGGAMSVVGRFCSLIPGLGVKLSTIILAGPTVLSAVGALPPHDGIRRRWRINVASAASRIESSKKNRVISPPSSSRQGRPFPRCCGNRVIWLCS